MLEYPCKKTAKELALETVAKVKRVVKAGNVTKITVARKGETLLCLPLTVSTVGLIAAPSWAILLATIATFGLDCSVELEKADGRKIQIV